jgi:hemolysin activation/secretion protein
VFRAGSDYVMEDLLLGAERSAVNLASVRLSQGMLGLGSTTGSNPTPSRPGQRNDFSKANATLSRTQTLFAPWQGASVALKGVFAGQIAGQILPSTEKFYLGGAELNRGFYSGQATGDQAISYTAELQLNTSFDTAIAGPVLNIPTQFYAFYDGGEVWQHTRLEPGARLASEGIGVRVNVTRFTEFDLEGVHRDTRSFGGTSTQVRPLPADAIYWRALARF